jgi:uncharacterized protein YihD (DUF1040 family)
MRDLSRIKRITDKLAAIWMKDPDSRLLQLFCSFLIRDFQTTVPDENGDSVIVYESPFFVEDDLIEARLDALLEKVGQ